MVLAGQFLERATIIDSGGTSLEGLWHRGEARPALLICPPHPRRGSSMDSPVCTELAFAATRAGHPTLRFNYRGAGASQGESSDELSACVDDARSALEALRASVGHGELAVAGYDFGAEVAVELARVVEGLRAVALVAPTGAAAELAKLPVPGMIAVGERDRGCDRLALAELCQSTGDELVVIEEADHVFSRGLSALGCAVVAFLGALPPSGF